MNKMKLIFKADLINEGFASNSVTSFIMYINPTVDEVVEIKTIVSEAVTNAIIHGYLNDPEQEVIIEAQIDENTLYITVEDYGCGIENIEQASLPLFTTKPGEEHAGMGLSIIEALADEFEILSTKDMGTKLMITKKIQSKNGK